MTVDHALAFFVFSFVAATTPGPSNIIITAAGANAGIIRGLPCFLGVVLGMGAMMGIVALGMGQIIVETPLLAKVMRWGGVAFLLWLAWKIATAKGNGTAPDARPVGFAGAVAFQWINPKSWLVCTGAAATFLVPDSGALFQQAALFGALFVAAAAPGCFLWLVLGAAMQRYLQTENRARVFNIAMAVLLAGSVIMFLE